MLRRALCRIRQHAIRSTWRLENTARIWFIDVRGGQSVSYPSGGGADDGRIQRARRIEVGGQSYVCTYIDVNVCRIAQSEE